MSPVHDWIFKESIASGLTEACDDSRVAGLCGPSSQGSLQARAYKMLNDNAGDYDIRALLLGDM